MSLTHTLFPSFSKYIVTLYHLFKFPVKKFKKYMKEVELWEREYMRNHNIMSTTQVLIAQFN